MKKKLYVVIICSMLLIVITGCGETGNNETSNKKDSTKVSSLECYKTKSDNWTKLASEYTITFKNNEFENAELKNTMTILSAWYPKTIEQYLDSIEYIYSGYQFEVISKDDESTTYTIKFDKNGIEQYLDTKIIGSDISSYKDTLESADYSCSIK